MANPKTRVRPRQGQGFSAPLLGSRYAMGGALDLVPTGALEGQGGLIYSIEDFLITDAAGADWNSLVVNTPTAPTAGASVGPRSYLNLAAGTKVDSGQSIDLKNTGRTVIDGLENEAGSANYRSFGMAVRVALGLGVVPTTLSTWSDKAFIGIGDGSSASDATVPLLSNANDVVTSGAGGCLGFHYKSDGSINGVYRDGAGVANSIEIAGPGAIGQVLGSTPAGRAGWANRRPLDLAVRAEVASPGAQSTLKWYVDNQEVARVEATPPGVGLGMPQFVAINGATNTQTRLMMDWLVMFRDRLDADN